jgi:hypothetical protein
MHPARRLEDRIRTLAMRLAVADEGEFQQLTAQLQAALSEHARRLQNKTSASVLAWPLISRDRRKLKTG